MRTKFDINILLSIQHELTDATSEVEIAHSSEVPEITPGF
jgi:hypothetical protein